MRRIWQAATIGAAVIGVGGLVGLASAQFSAPTQGVDGTAYDTPAQRDQAITTAIAAATPNPCAAPLPDALTATAGVMPTCMPRADAQRATQVQSLTVVTNSDGTFSGNWPVAFANTPTGRLADIELQAGATVPYKCSFYANTVTATAFSGKCWQLVATTLPTVTTALLGLVINPVQNAAAGLTVRVIGRQ